MKRIFKIVNKKTEPEPAPAPAPEEEQHDHIISSKQAYIFQTMLTCIGNKRKLVSEIESIFQDVLAELQQQQQQPVKDKLNIVDGFAGSTVVSRNMTYIADTIYTNDLEYYSYLMAQCFLIKPDRPSRALIQAHITRMNELAENGPFKEGIITRLYAPKDTFNVVSGERCFYTHENALTIDTLRDYIERCVEPLLQVYCLVPLLTRASIHTNTAGVFKGFYKHNDIGQFGGSAQVALSRIMKPIRLEMPIWNDECDYKVKCYNDDINHMIQELPDNIDVMYLDPPYNQHPYGSNYFMLNVIACNEEPQDISRVSGIPAKWNKSAYNNKKTAMESMSHLVTEGLKKSKYLLISYNNEGIIELAEWEKIFQELHVKKYEIKYDTFKGCRNLKDRSDKVIEIMYLVSKKPMTTAAEI
jgi:adenine-specific DNA-methyltransferase